MPLSSASAARASWTASAGCEPKAPSPARPAEAVQPPLFRAEFGGGCASGRYGFTQAFIVVVNESDLLFA